MILLSKCYICFGSVCQSQERRTHEFIDQRYHQGGKGADPASVVGLRRRVRELLLLLAGRRESVYDYQDYIDGKKEIAEINAQYQARFLRG